MHSTPLHAPSVMHIFSYFFRFLFNFCKVAETPTRTGSVVWIPYGGWDDACGCGKRKRQPKWKIDTNRAIPHTPNANVHFSTFFFIFVDFPPSTRSGPEIPPRICV